MSMSGWISLGVWLVRAGLTMVFAMDLDVDVGSG